MEQECGDCGTKVRRTLNMCPVCHPKLTQEYGSELDALMAAFRRAKEGDGYCFVIQNKYNWTISNRKPSLRFGKVIEVRDDGGQYAA